MFICVWKGMPTMNDDFLARIALIKAMFFSVFFSLTAPFVATGNTHNQLNIKIIAWQVKKTRVCTKVLHMCFERFLLAFESRDLSQAEKIIKRVSSFPSFKF